MVSWTWKMNFMQKEWLRCHWNCLTFTEKMKTNEFYGINSLFENKTSCSYLPP